MIYSRIPKNDFPPCDISDIFNVEMAERRKCLGKDFYDELVGDLVDYSAVESYIKGNSYVVDEVVEYKGVLYKALGSTTSEPSVKGEWELAPKFTTEKFEELWCRYLGKYLALVAVRNSLTSVSSKVTGAGIIKIEGENFRPAKDAEVIGVMDHVDSMVRMVYENMHDWILEEKAGGEVAFDKYRRIDEYDDGDLNECSCEVAQYYDPNTGVCEQCGGKCDSCEDNLKSNGNTWMIV